MRIYEYGKENPECILLIHPSLVTWDYFEYVIPLLEKHYHLLIPALPGYDLNDDSEFSSVEQIASELADDILKRGIQEVKAIYGCSMGGSIALRLAVDGKLKAKNYIMDGGITPYQLPWILTRFIAVRDFGMMALGKLGGEKLIVKAFSSTQYSEEDLKYVAKIFRHCTYKAPHSTVRRTLSTWPKYSVTAPIRRSGTPSIPATIIRCRRKPCVLPGRYITGMRKKSAGPETGT